MARHPFPTFYPTKNGYFVQYHKKRYRLETCDHDDRPDGPHYRNAMRRFQELLDQEQAEQQLDDTVKACVFRFQVHIAPRKASTIRSYTFFLKRFAADLGGIRAGDLTPHTLTSWIESHAAWGPSVRFDALQKLKAVFRFNHRFHRLPTDPFGTMPTPYGYSPTRRGDDYVLKPDLITLLLQHAEPDFRRLLFGLWRTGARPGELINAESFHYRPDQHAIVFQQRPARGYVHKTATTCKGGDGIRRIYLDSETEDMVRETASRKGWLFPTKSGARWYSPSINKHLTRLRNHPAVEEWCFLHGQDPMKIVPYSFRHTWITAAVKAGRPHRTIAILCGTSVRMIERHYCHASSDTAAMHAEFLRCI